MLRLSRPQPSLSAQPASRRSPASAGSRCTGRTTTRREVASQPPWAGNCMVMPISGEVASGSGPAAAAAQAVWSWVSRASVAGVAGSVRAGSGRSRPGVAGSSYTSNRAPCSRASAVVVGATRGSVTSSTSSSTETGRSSARGSPVTIGPAYSATTAVDPDRCSTMTLPGSSSGSPVSHRRVASWISAHSTAAAAQKPSSRYSRIPGAAHEATRTCTSSPSSPSEGRNLSRTPTASSPSRPRASAAIGPALLASPSMCSSTSHASAGAVSRSSDSPAPGECRAAPQELSVVPTERIASVSAPARQRPATTRPRRTREG